MTRYVPPVTLREYKRGNSHYHLYFDGNNQRIPGVTTILSGGIPKPNLIDWAAKATAEGAVDRWDELSDLPPAKRYKALERIRYETTNTAKNRGTDVHDIGARIVTGQEVTDIPDILAPYVENYIRFLDTYEVQPILIETVIVNYTLGYAGTLDLVADITSPLSGERERYLLDIKTGEKGVFAETALQLYAYRWAEYFLDNDGAEQPMIPVDAAAAVNVTTDDAVLVPCITEKDARVVAGRTPMQLFQMAQYLYAYDNEKDSLVAGPVRTETTSKYRLTREDQQ